MLYLNIRIGLKRTPPALLVNCCKIWSKARALQVKPNFGFGTVIQGITVGVLYSFHEFYRIFAEQNVLVESALLSDTSSLDCHHTRHDNLKLEFLIQNQAYMAFLKFWYRKSDFTKRHFWGIPKNSFSNFFSIKSL